jgi:hypothetical protein
MTANSIISLIIAGLLLIAVSLFCLAVSKIIKARIFLKHAKKTVGVVAALAQARNSDGGVAYVPVVSFFAANDHQYQVTGSTGSNPPAYKIGDEVTVCFLPKRPQEAKIYSFLDIHTTALLYSVFGAVTLIVTGVLYVSADR